MRWKQKHGEQFRIPLLNLWPPKKSRWNWIRSYWNCSTLFTSCVCGYQNYWWMWTQFRSLSYDRQRLKVSEPDEPNATRGKLPKRTRQRHKCRKMNGNRFVALWCCRRISEIIIFRLDNKVSKWNFCDMHENFADFQYAKCNVVYCVRTNSDLIYRSGRGRETESRNVCFFGIFGVLHLHVVFIRSLTFFGLFRVWFRNGKEIAHVHHIQYCMVLHCLDSLILTASFALKFSHSHCAHGQTLILKSDRNAAHSHTPHTAHTHRNYNA